MKVIDSAKRDSLSSSGKMVAASLEKEYMTSMLTGTPTVTATASVEITDTVSNPS